MCLDRWCPFQSSLIHCIGCRRNDTDVPCSSASSSLFMPLPTPFAWLAESEEEDALGPSSL